MLAQEHFERHKPELLNKKLKVLFWYVWLTDIFECFFVVIDQFRVSFLKDEVTRFREARILLICR